MLELSNLFHCVQHPWKFTSRHYWSPRNKRKPLSMLKYVLRKCHGVSQKWWMLELSNLCHCVQYPWKLNSRDFWSSRNERKPLSKQKCVLRKCCGVSQKCSDIPHTTCQMKWPRSDVRWTTQIVCQIYPPKLVRWSNKDEMWYEIPRKAVKYTPQCEHWVLRTGNFSTPENLLVGISGALGTRESHFLS